MFRRLANRKSFETESCGITIMSSKKMMMLGLFVGSTVGGYIPILLGAGMFSFTSLFGSGAGGIIGIWLAKKITD